MGLTIMNKIEGKVNISKAEFNMVLFQVGNEKTEINIKFTVTPELSDAVNLYQEESVKIITEEMEGKDINLQNEKEFSSAILGIVKEKGVDFLQKLTTKNKYYNKILEIINKNEELHACFIEAKQLVEDSLDFNVDYEQKNKILNDFEEAFATEVIGSVNSKVVGFQKKTGI